MITIANVRDLPPPSEWKPWVVYVGRAAPRRGVKRSPLANPYNVGQWPTHSSMWPLGEDDVMYWYRVWLHRASSVMKMIEMGHLRSLLKEHGKLVLACWCVPRRCHAEVIREVLDAD